MARDFELSTPDYMLAGSALITSPPFTLSLWGNSENDAAQQTAFAIGHTTDGSSLWSLEFQGSGAGDNIRWNAISAGGNSIINTTSSFSVSTWHHVAAREAATNSRFVYLDADVASRGSSGSSSTPGSGALDETGLGTRILGGFGTYFDGLIMEVALWSADLTEAEIAILAAGFAPPFVRPQSLIHYWPLLSGQSPEVDLIGGAPLTFTGSPSVAPHGRIIYPSAPHIITVPAAVAGPTVPDQTLAPTQSQMNSGGMVGTINMKRRDRIYVPEELQ